MPPPLRNVPIAQWREGETVQGFAYLARKEHRQDRKGNHYLHLELQDRSGAITAKVWPDSTALLGRFEALQFVAVEGLVQRYREELQLNVRRCRSAGEDDRRYGFDESVLVPTSGQDLDQLWARLLAALDHVERPVLRHLVEETLAVHGPGLREHPAAKSIHHAYRGGLLEHVVSMLELAVRVCGHYGELDRDLVLVGCLFHDLGKLIELGAMPLNDYTREGRLIGHIVLGRDLLRERTAAITDFPADLRLLLEHLVLSHQGTREYGSPVEPMTPEALVLHFVDDLDSKLEQLRKARTMGGGFQYLRPMGRHIFFGDEEVVPPVDEEAVPPLLQAIADAEAAEAGGAVAPSAGDADATPDGLFPSDDAEREPPVPVQPVLPGLLGES
jgi:3'-5' exoribonuclease